MPRRRYDRAIKAKVVALATMTSTLEAAQSIGANESTVRYWLEQPEFASLRDKTSDQVADEFWAVIQLGVKRIAELIPQTDDIAKVGVATGILYDKRALLTGGATGRTESRDLTGTLADSDVAAAIREATTVVGGSDSRATETSEDPPEG